jgi:hypothetical protein
MNRKLVVAALLAMSGSVQALQPGDLAFTAFNADEDGFALVALKSVPAFTTVHFSDNEWNGGAPGVGAFNTGESTFAWVSGSTTLPAGSVVRFSAIDQATRSSSTGAFTLLVSGTPGFAATGDTIFAYIAGAGGAPTGFIAALSSDNFAGSNLAGTDLAVGVNAVAITLGADFGEYTGIRSGLGSFPAYASLVNNASNWTAFATGEFASTVPNLAPFTVTAVPEPQTYALLLTGLALIGLRLRERLRMRSGLALA